MTGPNLGHIGVGQARGVNRGRGRGSVQRPAVVADDYDDVWRVLRDYMQESAGRPPSAREIVHRTGRSLGSVQRALRLLEQRRLITLSRFGQARGIRIIGARYVLPDGPATGREGHEQQ